MPHFKKKLNNENYHQNLQFMQGLWRRQKKSVILTILNTTIHNEYFGFYSALLHVSAVHISLLSPFYSFNESMSS